MKTNNKGFSLVELIIVIAIMAILVGIMAPQLLKYIEKANVSSDQQLLDAVYDAIVFAYVDPDVIADPNSDIVRGLLDDPTHPLLLESIPDDTRFYTEVITTLGWDDLQQTTYKNLLQSKHDDAHIYMYYAGDFDNPLIMWITTTDASGGKDTSHNPTTVSTATMDEIRSCIHIN